MTENDLTAVDAMAPGLLVLVCAAAMVGPVVCNAVRERWVGMVASLAATGLLVNIGIGTTMTQLEQGLFPASRHWAPPSTKPLAQMAWATSILMLVVFVVMCGCTKGYQLEFFSASTLAVLACVSNLRWISDSSHIGDWVNIQRVCEGVALFLLLVCGPIRACVRAVAKKA